MHPTNHPSLRATADVPLRGATCCCHRCPCSQVHLAGDEWLLRNVDEPPVLHYRVRVGGEYSAGGEAQGPACRELSFSATCLTRL